MQRLVAHLVEQAGVAHGGRGLGGEPAEALAQVGVAAQPLGPVEHVGHDEPRDLVVDDTGTVAKSCDPVRSMIRSRTPVTDV
ncbi:MAG: hypothetical protein KatS3mg009_3035 [Acidimicrobiia bacterium]|nr:MAG: hypothetical protein KatS3mg009_3035 [Acidimicrobiia bacterium]